MTSKKRLIGYGYTNGSGIATLDYTADGTDIKTLEPTGISGYIGSGGGEIDIKAELHDDDTVQSAPYPLCDAEFYDGGNNNNWWYTSTYSSLSHNNGNTILSFDTSGSSYSLTYPSLIAIADLPSSWAEKEEAMRWITTDVAIEFDLVSSSTTYFQIRVNDGTNRKDISSPNITGVEKIKFELKNGYVYIYLDGVVQPNPTAWTYTECSVSFIQNTTLNELIIKNFRIYPI